MAEMNYQNISSFPFAQFSSLLTTINMSIDKMRDVTFSVNVFFSQEMMVERIKCLSNPLELGHSLC